LKQVTQLVGTYPQGFMVWMGPIFPLINLCHPDIVRSVLNASGIHGEWLVVGAMAHLSTSSYDPMLLYGSVLAPPLLPCSLSTPSIFPSCLHQLPF
jgi:hypothetical protein